LYQLLEITSGVVRVDGVDVTTLSRDAVRAKLITLPQETLFVPGTIKHNLTLWSDVNHDRIENALRKVELWQRVCELGGLETLLDPSTMFSQGQRQLFCLARAMLKDGPILVIDEATSKYGLTPSYMRHCLSANF